MMVVEMMMMTMIMMMKMIMLMTLVMMMMTRMRGMTVITIDVTMIGDHSDYRTNGQRRSY